MVLECQAAKSRYTTSRVSSGSHEELPHVQGKEQQLCFAGAAVKRYPTSKVREAPVRQEALKEALREQTD